MGENVSQELLAEKIADSLWQIWRKLSHPAKQGKITPEQYLILLFLNKYGPQRIKDIAARLGTGSSSATLSIKRLEKGGLVIRKRGKDDERTVTVCLTEYGRDIFNTWRLERRSTLSNFFRLLDDDDKHQLDSLLMKVISQLKKED